MILLLIEIALLIACFAVDRSLILSARELAALYFAMGISCGVVVWIVALFDFEIRERR